MKVLVVGSGAREHAICWKLKQSPLVTALYAAPGNPGIGNAAALVDIKVDNIRGLADFALRERIDFTVVGPEVPLSLGLADLFTENGLRIFGPSARAARLESSKSFAKEVMLAAGVRTARYTCFESRQELNEHINRVDGPIVLKADGLAQGKGVIVCANAAEALQASQTLFGTFAAARVVAEEFLAGVEASFIVATNGSTIVPMASSHDYKRIFDGDSGPNTGGMGSVSPTPRLSAEQERSAVDKIIRPVLNEMSSRGIPFSGFLYAGLMILPNGDIAVIEFNARLGDPECQSILRRMKTDFMEILLELDSEEGVRDSVRDISWRPDSAVCVVLASKGYPDKPQDGFPITGIDRAAEMEGIEIFHAGTALSSAGELISKGGRVLSVTALAGNVADARARAHQACDLIQFSGVQRRRDIGA